MPKHKTITDYVDTIPDGPETLHYDPARAAALLLVDFWAGMDADGQSLDQLLQDIDEVCAILQAWKSDIAAIY